MKENTYKVTLRTIYPNLRLCAHKDEEEKLTDKQLHEQLELKYSNPLVVFMAGEGEKPVSLYNWH